MQISFKTLPVEVYKLLIKKFNICKSDHVWAERYSAWWLEAVFVPDFRTDFLPGVEAAGHHSWGSPGYDPFIGKINVFIAIASYYFYFFCGNKYSFIYFILL